MKGIKNHIKLIFLCMLTVITSSLFFKTLELALLQKSNLSTDISINYFIFQISAKVAPADIHLYTYKFLIAFVIFFIATIFVYRKLFKKQTKQTNQTNQKKTNKKKRK